MPIPAAAGWWGCSSGARAAVVPEQEPSRDLPAPYRSPWGALLEDLRAVLASLRLELWQLWRRNRQGLLPLPALWPKGLAAWFWPGLLLALAALLIALLLLGRALLPEQPNPLPAPAAVEEIPANRPVQAPPPPRQFPPSAPLPEAEPPSSPAQGASQQERAGEPVPVQEPVPVLAAFADSDPQGLLLEARPRPAAGELVLVLSPGWLELPLPLRDRQAAAWQERALEQGYERLLLQTPAGQLLARPALVGSGMILLTPVAPPDADRA